MDSTIFVGSKIIKHHGKLLIVNVMPLMMSNKFKGMAWLKQVKSEKLLRNHSTININELKVLYLNQYFQ